MKIQTQLNSLGLSTDNSVVVGSGILNALNIRDSNYFVIIVTKEKYKELSQDKRFTNSNSYGEVLTYDNLDIRPSWVIVAENPARYYNSSFSTIKGLKWPIEGRTFNFEDILPHSVVIDNIRYNSIELLYKIKKYWVFDKRATDEDLKDIELIESYLKSKTDSKTP